MGCTHFKHSRCISYLSNQCDSQWWTWAGLLHFLLLLLLLLLSLSSWTSWWSWSSLWSSSSSLSSSSSSLLLLITLIIMWFSAINLESIVLQIYLTNWPNILQIVSIGQYLTGRFHYLRNYWNNKFGDYSFSMLLY